MELSEDRKESPPSDQARELIGKKWISSWGTAIDIYGVSRFKKAAEILYLSTYFPEEFRDRLQKKVEREQSDKADLLDGILASFEDRLPNLSESLPGVSIKNAPSEEEFVNQVVRAVTKEVDFESYLYEGAVESLEELADEGRVVVWTAGDTESFGQIKKVAIAGIGKVKRRIASEKGKESFKLRIAENHRDKAKSLADEVLQLKESNVNIETVAVIEDQLKNLVAAEAKVDELGLRYLPIWVRQGKHRNSVPQSVSDIDSYNPVESISEASRKVTQSVAGTKNVFFVDFDGVLSEDKTREKQQKTTVYEKLRKNGWV